MTGNSSSYIALLPAIDADWVRRMAESDDLDKATQILRARADADDADAAGRYSDISDRVAFQLHHGRAAAIEKDRPR